MKIKYSFIFVALLGLLFIAGCTKEYGNKDVAEYLKKEYGLKNFGVSSEYEEITGQDGYKDRLWTIRLVDEDLTFHVLDDYHWGTEWVTNDLCTDYEYVIESKYFEKFGNSLFELEKEPYRDILESCKLKASYRNRLQLESLFDEYDRFKDFLSENGVDIYVRAMCLFDSPLGFDRGGTLDDGDIVLNTKVSDSYDRNEGFNTLLWTCLDHRFNDIIGEFSENEISQAVASASHRVCVSNSDTTGYQPYDNILASRYGYGISFGALYDILVLENYPVIGSNFDYSFISPNGDKYEISYNYNDYEYTNYDMSISYGYYYILNGEKVPMDYYFYNHFRTGKIKEMTGIDLSC